MIFTRICWGLTLLVACIAGIDLVYTITAAQSAPQQAAGAALVAATCIVPYVFTRCVEGLSQPLAPWIAPPAERSPQPPPDATEDPVQHEQDMRLAAASKGRREPRL